MTGRQTKPPSAILIIDDDCGFVVWLGHTLAADGYLTVPATSSQQAEQFIAQLGIKIGLLIVNLAIPGMADLVRTLQSSNPSLRTIAIRVTGAGLSPTVTIDAAHSRSQSDWLATVRQVLDTSTASGAS